MILARACPLVRRVLFFALELRIAALLWSYAADFFVGADKVTGIGKAGFLADVVEGFVGVEQESVCLTDSDEFNIFLTGFSELSFKLFCKV